MNYETIYTKIITRARERILEGYSERHHIIPRCMGGSDEIDNLVNLTPEEHYVCHQLLVKIYPENVKLLYAIQAMSMPGSVGMRCNKIYGWLKRKFSESRKNGLVKECIQCKGKFYVSAKNNKKYCSRDCFMSHKSVSVECIQCGKEFSRPNSLDTAKKEKFCSLQCKYDYKSYFFECRTCGAEVRVPKCRARTVLPTYCSRKCKGNGWS